MLRMLFVAVIAATAGSSFGNATAAGGRTLFVESAVEHRDGTVTLPLRQGTSGGQKVWYIVLDASSSELASRFGVNRSNKLTNAAGTAAVQQITGLRGTVDFPATVDFAPERVIEASNGFPPTRLAPGAVGEDGYSPMIELPNGEVVNAPHVANATGRADKVVSIDKARGRVTMQETNGFANGKRVRYLSTDASDPLAATLENVTLAPALNAAPFAGGDGTDSSRATLVAFANGQTGADNPQRQGLNSAIRDGLDPLNVLAWTPNQGRHSPILDVFVAEWSADAVAGGRNLRQKDVDVVTDSAEEGIISGPGGGGYGPAGFVVNCPIISEIG